jgi:hypothetical protein
MKIIKALKLAKKILSLPTERMNEIDEVLGCGPVSLEDCLTFVSIIRPDHEPIRWTLDKSWMVDVRYDAGVHDLGWSRKPIASSPKMVNESVHITAYRTRYVEGKES